MLEEEGGRNSFIMPNHPKGESAGPIYSADPEEGGKRGPSASLRIEREKRKENIFFPKKKNSTY